MTSRSSWSRRFSCTKIYEIVLFPNYKIDSFRSQTKTRKTKKRQGWVAKKKWKLMKTTRISKCIQCVYFCITHHVFQRECINIFMLFHRIIILLSDRISVYVALSLIGSGYLFIYGFLYVLSQNHICFLVRSGFFPSFFFFWFLLAIASL